MEAQIWMDAATQIFFSLSLGFGALIAFASYNPLHNNIIRDAYIVVLTDCLTAVFGGMVVFSILGHRHYVTGVPVDKVVIVFSTAAFIKLFYLFFHLFYFYLPFSALQNMYNLV